MRKKDWMFRDQRHIYLSIKKDDGSFKIVPNILPISLFAVLCSLPSTSKIRTVLECEFQQTVAPGESKFFRDLETVIVDGLLTEEELLCDLFARF